MPSISLYLATVRRAIEGPFSAICRAISWSLSGRAGFSAAMRAQIRCRTAAAATPSPWESPVPPIAALKKERSASTPRGVSTVSPAVTRLTVLSCTLRESATARSCSGTSCSAPPSKNAVCRRTNSAPTRNTVTLRCAMLRRNQRTCGNHSLKNARSLRASRKVVLSGSTTTSGRVEWFSSTAQPLPRRKTRRSGRAIGPEGAVESCRPGFGSYRFSCRNRSANTSTVQPTFRLSCTRRPEASSGR